MNIESFFGRLTEDGTEEVVRYGFAMLSDEKQLRLLIELAKEHGHRAELEAEYGEED